MRPTTAIAIVAALVAVLRPPPAGAEPRAKLRDHVPPWARAESDLGVVGDEPLDHVTLWLTRTPERQRAFDELVRAQQTAGSPHYHEWLTPAQIGERFGASDAQIDAVTTWLAGRGFAVRRVSNSRMFVELSGSTAIASAAFGVQFHRYALRDGARLSIDREPSVPPELAPFVAAVTGLVEMHAVAASHGVFDATSPDLAPTLGSNGTHTISAADFATIYDVGPLYAAGFTGSGQTVGIIGRSRVFAADITNYSARMNVAVPTPTIIIPTGGQDPGAACGATSGCTVSDDQLESTLDVDRVGSTAPGAAIEQIISKSIGNSDGVVIALQYAVDTYGTAVHANVLSISYAECETSAGASLTSMVDALYAQAAMQGQTVVVCSGDSGAAMCDAQNAKPPATQTRDVNYLCTSDAVVCVGGTELIDPTASDYWSGSGAALSYVPEGAWNEPGTAGATVASASGGGASKLVAVPAFQMGIAPTGATGRVIPDVAFSAAGHDGYFACLAAYGASCVLGSDGSYSSGFIYGTSAAAPSMAGVMALVDQATGSNQGAVNTELYQLAAAAPDLLHDVTLATSGVASCALTMPSTCNNTTPSSTALTGGEPGYEVGSGFDLVTGWGSLDVSDFVAHWPGVMVTPSLLVDPGSLELAPGAQATVALQTSGFLTATTFTCSGTPADATCAFSTTSTGQPILTVSVAGDTGSAGSGAMGSAGSGRALALVLGGAVFALWLARHRRGQGANRARHPAFALALGLGLASCSTEIAGTSPDGGSGSNSNQSTITVTATGGAGEMATAPLTLTVMRE